MSSSNVERIEAVIARLNNTCSNVTLAMGGAPLPKAVEILSGVEQSLRSDVAIMESILNGIRSPGQDERRYQERLMRELEPLVDFLDTARSEAHDAVSFASEAESNADCAGDSAEDAVSAIDSAQEIVNRLTGRNE